MGSLEKDSPPSLQSLSEEVYRATRADPRRSVDLARSAIALARRSGSPADLGLAARSLGHAWRAAARYRRALAAYAASDRAYAKAGQAVERSRNAIGKLDALMYLGRYEEALAEASRAEQVFALNGEIRRLATLRVNLGSVYFRLDRYVEAAAAYEGSLGFFEAEGDEDTVANIRLNLASVKSCLLAFAEAERLYELAAAYYEAAGMRVLEALTQYNLACLDSIRGHYSAALQKLERAIGVLNSAGDQSLLGSCRLEQADIFLSLGMPESAGRVARDAAERFEGLGMRYEHAKCRSSEGVSLALSGDPGGALRALADALRLFRLEGNAHWIGLCRLHLAEVHRGRGRLEEASTLAEEALRSLAQLEEPRAVALAHLVLGSTGGKAARTHLGRAIRELRRAEVSALEAEALATLGRALHREGRSRGARRCLRLAIELAETLRARLTEGSLRRHFHSTKADLYARMALLERAGPAASLGWLEQGRARTLVEILDDRDYRGEGAGGSAGLERDGAAREQLNLLYRKLDAQTWTGERAAERERVRERIRSLELQLGDQELSARLGTSTRHSQIAGELSEAAGPGEADGRESLSVEYFEVDGVVGAVALRSEAIRMFPSLCPVAEIAVLLRQLRLGLAGELTRASQRPPVASGSSSLYGELRQLYEMLLGPIEQELGIAERLLVLPSGVLAYVPFAALLDKEGMPVVSRSGLSHSPSLAVQRRWLGLRSRPPLPVGSPALVLGHGPDLPEIERETSEVAKLLPGPVLRFTGSSATTAAFRDHAPRSRVLHLACHGIFRRDHPLFSSLVLADGRLSFYDLFRMQLHADLVVLSACETGHSDGSPGEELLGLSGGLLMAGARAVVVSLWEVIDASSARFMELMYSRLAAGMPVAQALAGAMVEMQKLAPHPAHWAPYILLGDPGVIIV